MKSYQITVSGRVQRVGFRFHTHKTANLMSIKGFVMNKPNGDVYIEAEGEDQNLNEFILWCRKGPDWSTVTDIKIIEQPVCNYKTFDIK